MKNKSAPNEAFNIEQLDAAIAQAAEGDRTIWIDRKAKRRLLAAANRPRPQHVGMRKPRGIQPELRHARDVARLGKLLDSGKYFDFGHELLVRRLDWEKYRRAVTPRANRKLRQEAARRGRRFNRRLSQQRDIWLSQQRDIWDRILGPVRTTSREEIERDAEKFNLAIRHMCDDQMAKIAEIRDLFGLL